MKFFELTYIIEDEYEERLEQIAKRFQKINGWDEKEILQFAVGALIKPDIEFKLDFLEKTINQLEKEKHS